MVHILPTPGRLNPANQYLHRPTKEAPMTTDDRDGVSVLTAEDRAMMLVAIGCAEDTSKPIPSTVARARLRGLILLVRRLAHDLADERQATARLRSYARERLVAVRAEAGWCGLCHASWMPAIPEVHRPECPLAATGKEAGDAKPWRVRQVDGEEAQWVCACGYTNAIDVCTKCGALKPKEAGDGR